MSLIDTLLSDGAQLLVEELPKLEQLAEAVASAIAQKKGLAPEVAQAEVLAADAAADAFETAKFGPKEGA